MTMFKIEFPQELINEYVLSKQHLKQGYKSNNFEEMIDDIIGLAASNFHTPLLSSYARIDSFKVLKDFYKLIQNKKIIKTPAMRKKLFIISNEFVPIIETIYLKKNKTNETVGSILNAHIKLVSAYIYAYGPVSVNDIIWWTGLNKKDINDVLVCIKDNLIALAIEKISENYYMLKIDYEQMINWYPEKNININFLPGHDNYLTGYFNKERFFNSKEDITKIYHKKNIFPSMILSNSKIIGIWHIERKKIETNLFSNSKIDSSSLFQSEKQKIEEFYSQINLDKI